MLRNAAAKTVFAGKFPGSAGKTGSIARARFWFQLVGTMIRNHIDERQLNGSE
ncbi:hypothetical protein [Bradyrhizobium centrolobii]|uniref:hypothetical protein n=1 Tax=Bradyrhizobium centrolobii TaxID=1505087 RepID=UPI000AE3E9D5|nr:hypothetical protein [Bradyrhizobium centrolobii]